MVYLGHPCRFFFFFNDTATTEIYTLSLHDALPISEDEGHRFSAAGFETPAHRPDRARERRSEEHTSELQSLAYLVCRLLLEKKKKNMIRAVIADKPTRLEPARSPHTLIVDPDPSTC